MRSFLLYAASLVGAVLSVVSCAPTTTHTVRVIHTLDSFSHDATLPWGAIPVLPDTEAKDPLFLHAQVALAGAVDRESPSMESWNPFPVRGVLAMDHDFGLFQWGLGASLSRSTAFWTDLVLVDRGEKTVHPYAELAVGAEFLTETSHFTTTRTKDSGMVITREYSHSTLKKDVSTTFARAGVGLIPAETGPWVALEVLGPLQLARWPGDYTEHVETQYLESGATSQHVSSTDKDPPQSNSVGWASLAGGWRQAVSHGTATVGVRYSMSRHWHQAELVTQFTLAVE